VSQVRIYTNKYETQDEDGQLEEVYSRYRQLINSELHYLAISYPML
jgi:F-box protein 39